MELALGVVSVCNRPARGARNRIGNRVSSRASTGCISTTNPDALLSSYANNNAIMSPAFSCNETHVIASIPRRGILLFICSFINLEPPVGWSLSALSCFISKQSIAGLQLKVKLCSPGNCGLHCWTLCSYPLRQTKGKMKNFANGFDLR